MPETPLSLDECVSLVNNISRRRHLSRRAATAPSGSSSTPDEVIETEQMPPPAEVEQNGAMRVWGEMFPELTEDAMITVLEQFDYVRKVGEMVDTQKKRMFEHIFNELKRKHQTQQLSADGSGLQFPSSGRNYKGSSLLLSSKQPRMNSLAPRMR